MAKRGHTDKYPQTRRGRRLDTIAVFADFCARHVRRILNARDIPPSVQELLENGRVQCHATAAKVGVELLTHRECPDLLQNGQLLLWPEDEPKPDGTLADLPDAPAYDPNDGRQFVPSTPLSANQISNVLFEGDCLDILPFFPPHSVDLILCDLPYGTTQNRWDSVIPLEKLWTQYMRILKPTGVVALTSQGVFTAKVILSNEPWFKYKIVWEKSKPTNFLNAKKQPLRKHEDICVFYQRQPVYHPQMRQGQPYDKGVRKNQLSGSYGDFLPARVRSGGDRYPTDVVYFKTAENEGPVWHPTQKPVELGRYLVRTYTDPGDLILDNAFGSGSFLVAAAQEGRRFVGIELNQDVHLFKRVRIDYVGLARQRIEHSRSAKQEAL